MTGREIVCNRFVSCDSEFDAKKGQGEPPGPPVCICAVEIDSQGRVTEHRLKAPYPAMPPWEHGPRSIFAIVFAGSAEAGSYMHVVAVSAAVIDLYAEYMVIHNTEMVRKAARGESKPPGPSLIKAASAIGVKGWTRTTKTTCGRSPIPRPITRRKRSRLLQDYCIERLLDGGAAVQGDAAAH